MSSLLKLYHRLPYPLRTLAATARGYQLRRWRYGAETEALMAEVTEREQWSADQWRAWREERLAHLLHRAATQVPYYRNQWQARRRLGDRAAWETLDNWPLLKKEAVRQHPEAFVADDRDIRQMFHEHTSGTTGKPIQLWWSRETVRAWYALFESRGRRWHGVSRHHRWGILGGQLVTPVTQKGPPFWVWNGAFRQLYLSVYHLAVPNIPAYLAAMSQHGINYLLGYSSALYRLAEVALFHNLAAPRLSVVITNAEPLYDYQRATIAAAFDCPVRETYGLAEIVTAASECEAGRLHLWPEVGVPEVWADEDDTSLKSASTGRLIATGLLNDDMPLIRYETGDRGRQPTWEAYCPCGRTLPIMPPIEGRLDDVIITPDGRHIGRLDPIFKADLPLREAQIIQEETGALRLLVVPSERFDAATDVPLLANLLRDRVGDMDITVETTEEIPRMAGGKFRAVVSHLRRLV